MHIRNDPAHAVIKTNFGLFGTDGDDLAVPIGVGNVEDRGA
jgi:hypothetical protein